MTSEMLTAGSVFENGDLRVDYAGGCAYLDGQELHLTPIEFKLLCLLSRNVGKVLTHTFITQNIWGAKLGQQHGLPAGLHGKPSQEAGTHPGFSPVHPDTHWRGIPYGQGGVTAEPNARFAADSGILAHFVIIANDSRRGGLSELIYSEKLGRICHIRVTWGRYIVSVNRKGFPVNLKNERVIYDETSSLRFNGNYHDRLYGCLRLPVSGTFSGGRSPCCEAGAKPAPVGNAPGVR